ncbi:unnamed protein product [Phyllotreta striolata]|uniref:glyceraldehyde-3-phosphate dehydrogenase (NADP(+)) (phosphorylating) n=1 Tax=Phyllotreta striolata TaxID=444603 RepID=A0A9N9TXB0_PHYSR|nr:unnamed protein product [Phyllotreta striolata]
MVFLGINGFGRIGRMILKLAIERDMEVRAINEPNTCDTAFLAYIFKHDSTHGRFFGKAVPEGDCLNINGMKIRVYRERDPSKVPWLNTSVDYVVDSSGKFTCRNEANKLLCGGAKKAVVCGLSDDIPMYLCGINLKKYKSSEKIVSLGACCTNCLAPIAKVLNDKFGIASALVTSLHSVTHGQQVLDAVGKQYRLSRGAFQNIIPTAPKAFDAVTKVIPALKKKILGIQYRVPTPNVSVMSISVQLKKCTSYKQVKCVIREAAENDFKGVLGYTEEQAVSTDFLGSTCSSVFDASAGQMLNPKTYHLVSWYDNEVGYSSRVLDTVKHMEEQDIIAREMAMLKQRRKKQKC